MPKLLALLCLLVLISRLPAQEISDERNRITLDGGITNLRSFALNDSVFGGFQQLNTLGLTNSVSYTGKNGSWVGHDAAASLHWFLPKEIQATDTSGRNVKYRMKGWELMTSFYGFDFIPAEHVDLVIAPGFYWGSLKIQRTDAASSTLYKNPFVAPMARAELRFNFGKITFGGRASYRYDISQDTWKQKNTPGPSLSGYYFRDTQLLLYIGYCFDRD